MKMREKLAYAAGSGAHPEEMFDQVPRLITYIIPQSQTKFVNLRVPLNKMALNFMRQKKKNNKNTNNFKILTKQRTKKLNKSLQF